MTSPSDEQDALEAAQHQQQLDERRMWDTHHEALQNFRKWENDMDSEWDRIERELRQKACKV